MQRPFIFNSVYLIILSYKFQLKRIQYQFFLIEAPDFFLRKS